MLDFHRPMRTLGGAPVRIVCWDRRDPAHPIVALAHHGDHETVLCIDANGQCIDPPSDWEGDYLEENPNNVVNGMAERTAVATPRSGADAGTAGERAHGAPLDRSRPIRTRWGGRGRAGENAGMPVRVVCWDCLGDRPIVALYEDGTGEGVTTARLDGSVGRVGYGTSAYDLVNVDPAAGDRQRVLVRVDFELLLEPGEVADPQAMRRRIREATAGTLGRPGAFLTDGPRVVRIMPLRWDLPLVPPGILDFPT